MSQETEDACVCAGCLELIQPPMLCYTLDLVRSVICGSRVRHALLLRDGSEAPIDPEEGEEGASCEPELEALYFHDGCWDDVSAEVSAFLSDVPPTSDIIDVVSCDLCGDTIRIGERSSLLRRGRQVASKRRDGSSTFHKTAGDIYDLCLTCAMRVADVVECDSWSELSQNHECYSCTRNKCWRQPGRCGCGCHEEEE